MMSLPTRRPPQAAHPYIDPIPELKRDVARAIVRTIDGWTQCNAAALLHIDQPRISDLRNDRLERFSLDQLIRLLAHADGVVELRFTSPNRCRWIFKPAEPTSA